MGHAKVGTTLGVYAHLFNTDDHADAMAAGCHGYRADTSGKCCAAVGLGGLY
jgi:hypothetical protein